MQKSKTQQIIMTIIIAVFGFFLAAPAHALKIKVSPSLTTTTIKKLSVKSFSSVTRFHGGGKINFTDGSFALFSEDSEIARLSNLKIGKLTKNLAKGAKSLAKNAALAKSSLDGQGGLNASYIESLLKSSGLTYNEDLIKGTIDLFGHMRTDYVTVDVADEMAQTQEDYYNMMSMYVTESYSEVQPNDGGDEYAVVINEDDGSYTVWYCDGSGCSLYATGSGKSDSSDSDNHTFLDDLCDAIFGDCGGDGITWESEGGMHNIFEAVIFNQTIAEDYGTELQYLATQYASGKLSATQLNVKANTLLSMDVIEMVFNDIALQLDAITRIDPSTTVNPDVVNTGVAVNPAVVNTVVH